MCLIIASETGIVPKCGVLDNGFEDNPHGWGLMTPSFDYSKVEVIKGFTKPKFDEAIASLYGRPYAVHFRWATHGVKTEANCHPFKVSNNLYMMHNGVINIKEDNPTMSDTWHFAKVLKKSGITWENVRDSDVVDAMSQAIGLGNKLVFMDSGGNFTYVNKSVGTERDGIWYSNDNSFDEWRHRRYIYASGYGSTYIGGKKYNIHKPSVEYQEDWWAQREYRDNWEEKPKVISKYDATGLRRGKCDYCQNTDFINQCTQDGEKFEMCDECLKWSVNRPDLEIKLLIDSNGKSYTTEDHNKEQSEYDRLFSMTDEEYLDYSSKERADSYAVATSDDYAG